MSIKTPDLPIIEVRITPGTRCAGGSGQTLAGGRAWAKAAGGKPLCLYCAGNRPLPLYLRKPETDREKMARYGKMGG